MRNNKIKRDIILWDLAVIVAFGAMGLFSLVAIVFYGAWHQVVGLVMSAAMVIVAALELKSIKN